GRPAAGPRRLAQGVPGLADRGLLCRGPPPRGPGGGPGLYDLRARDLGRAPRIPPALCADGLLSGRGPVLRLDTGPGDPPLPREPLHHRGAPLTGPVQAVPDGGLRRGPGRLDPAPPAQALRGAAPRGLALCDAAPDPARRVLPPQLGPVRGRPV